jgi:hypothetical protein
MIKISHIFLRNTKVHGLKFHSYKNEFNIIFIVTPTMLLLKLRESALDDVCIFHLPHTRPHLNLTPLML